MRTYIIIGFFILPILSIGQNAIDSFYRDGQYWYCTDPVNLPVRSFYPRKNLRVQYFTLINIERKPIEWVRSTSEYFVLNSPSDFVVEIKVRRTRKVFTKMKLVKGTNIIFTKNWPCQYYDLTYFATNGNVYQTGWLERFRK